MKMIFSEKLMNRLFYALLVGVGLMHLYYVVVANSDLTSGRHVLFMDEWVTFDGVKRILSSSSVVNFFWNIIDGHDHRYGRIHWNVTAFFSALPYYVWGDSGLIIAQRMTSASLQIAAYLILTWSFVKAPLYRLFTFAILLVLPVSSYYSHMPKPEPLQLLLLSLFFREILVKRNIKFLPWLYLGLAFGAKISTLPYFIFVFGVLFFITEEKKAWLKSLGYGMAGFICAIPVLGLGKFENYLWWIRISITHPHDMQNTNFFSWWQLAFNGSAFQGLLFVSVFSGTLFLTTRDYSNKKLDLRTLFFDSKVQILLCALSFLLPVMVNVKRLWFMYFHLGTVFLFIWVIMTFEEWQNNQKKEHKTFLGVSSSILLLALFFYLAPSNREHLKDLARRTSSPGYHEKLEEYVAVTEFLEKIAKEQNRRLLVYYSPELFMPNSNRSYAIREGWNLLFSWGDGADVIVTYKRRRPGIALSVMNKNQEEFKSLDRALSMEKAYTVNCQQKLCYKELDFPLERILVYVRNPL